VLSLRIASRYGLGAAVNGYGRWFAWYVLVCAGSVLVGWLILAMAGCAVPVKVVKLERCAFPETVLFPLSVDAVEVCFERHASQGLPGYRCTTVGELRRLFVTLDAAQ
jgi:hypothetical protein